MKIVIASGKGGVGKSMVVSSLLILFSKKYKVLGCDCDVDAPKLDIWLGVKKHNIIKKVSTSEKAKIFNQEGLDDKVIKICPFGAIEKKKGKYVVNQMLCEGCRACSFLYPKNIRMVKVNNGEIRISKTKWGFDVISGQLYPGESSSGKIVYLLKEEAEKIDYEYMFLDSAAGTGCTVNASIKDSDYALLVTEPTPAAISDLKRVLFVVKHFGIPFSVVINKWNLNEKNTKKIEKMFEGRIIGKISYDESVIKSLVNMTPVVFSKSKASKELNTLYKNLIDVVGR